MENQFEVLQGYVGLGNCLIKADQKDPNIIYLEASNHLVDSQDDVVLQKALRDEVDSFLKKGVISWDHLHKIERNPKYICGEPLDVRFPKDGRTLVKARLYPNNEYGRTILTMARDGSTRLGASVGGAILRRTPAFVDSLKKSVKAIVKVLWDEVAVTHQPINEGTLGKVTFVPFGDFVKSFLMDDAERADALQKALSAGYGVDSSTFSGGRAVIPESLMGTKHADDRRKLSNAFKVTLANIRNGKVKDYKSLVTVLDAAGMKSYATIVADTVAQNKGKLKALLKI